MFWQPCPGVLNVAEQRAAVSTLPDVSIALNTWR
jgi:hypothetical protein